MFMKNKKIIALIVLLSIGFAAVSTNLLINGTIGIGSNESEFNIIFTYASLNGVERNDFIEQEKKQTLTFTTDKLTKVGEEAVLDYEVTNTSRLYDADVVIECNMLDENKNVIDNNDFIKITYAPDSMHIMAGGKETGSITAKLITSSTDEGQLSVKCTLNATATERVELGEPYAEPFTVAGTIKATASNNTSDFWGYKDAITKIVFEDKIEEKEDAEHSFDVSVDPEKPVMSYLVPNVDTSTYTLYIASNSGVYANPNSSYLFSGFSKLTSIEGLRYFNTSNVVNMSNMFANDKLLESLDLTHFNTSKVTNMSYMFSMCEELKELDASNFDTSNVTDMSGMFSSLLNLTKLNVSGFNTEKVTNMMMMFASDQKLLSLDLSSFNTSNVTMMLMMFTGCHHLTSLDVSNFDTTKVTQMNAMFMACMSLVDLDLSSFNTKNVTVMNQMFQNCTSLKNLDIRNFDFSSLQSDSCVFNIMPDDAKITVKNETVMNKILSMQAGKDFQRPEAWTTDNFEIAS